MLIGWCRAVAGVFGAVSVGTAIDREGVVGVMGDWRIIGAGVGEGGMGGTVARFSSRYLFWLLLSLSFRNQVKTL